MSSCAVGIISVGVRALLSRPLRSRVCRGGGRAHQNCVVEVNAVEAVETMIEKMAELFLLLVFISWTIWSTSLRVADDNHGVCVSWHQLRMNCRGTYPGIASKIISPALVKLISFIGVMAAPGSCSAPLATRKASRPGFTNMTIARSSENMVLQRAFLRL